MTQRQYQQTLRNKSLRNERLFETAACADLLRATARNVRLRAAAQQAWEAVCERDWRQRARVAGVLDGVASLECDDAVTCEQVRRSAAELLATMRLKVRGLRELRIRIARQTGLRDGDTNGGD